MKESPHRDGRRRLRRAHGAARIAALLCLLLALGSPALGKRHLGRPSFTAETASFLDGDSLKAFAYVEIPVRDLFFAPRSDEALEAVVDITVLIYQKGFQAAGDTWRHRLRAPAILAARNSPRALRRTLHFPVDPGNYEVKITVSQPEAGTGGTLKLPLKVIDISKKKLTVSSVLFGVCPADMDDVSEIQETPLLGARFGNPLPPVCVYAQVYHPAPPAESLLVKWTLETLTQSEVRSGTSRFFPSASGVTDVLIDLPLENLWMGTYGVRLDFELGRWKAERRATFEMDETRVSMGTDFQSTVDMVRIIADETETELLENAPPEERQEAWDDFWKGRDPTPGTDKNEFKEEFFRRIRYVNQHYGVLEPGWRSDRGQIYIRYGQPDQIESFPQNIDTPPYEIWQYFRLSARFVFVDYEGFGRYELYQPGRPARQSR